MKIKYITNTRIPTTRAHGHAIMKMCTEFSENGNDVELFVPNKGDIEYINKSPFIFYKVKENFKINKVSSFDFLANSGRLGKIWYWVDTISYLVSLKFFVKVSEEDVIYTRDFLIPLIFTKKNNIILELHNIPRSRFLIKQIFNKINLFVVISRGIKEELIKMSVNEEKIIVCPSGVDIQDLETNLTKDEAKDFLKLDKNKKVAMYIGLLDEWKGYKTFLESSKFLPESIQVVIIGGEGYQINKLSKLYKKVIFLGLRPYSELGINQKAADVLVIPNSEKYAISKYYTSPLKVFNHMASGTPIVASDLPSIREILNENNCVFASPDSPESLANSIIKVLNDNFLSKKISEQARTDVEKFTWSNRTKQILDFINKNNV
jgi:glycosyltransferase involved in cell wall biosynthesis